MISMVSTAGTRLSKYEIMPHLLAYDMIMGNARYILYVIKYDFTTRVRSDTAVMLSNIQAHLRDRYL